MISEKILRKVKNEEDMPAVFKNTNYSKRILDASDTPVKIITNVSPSIAAIKIKASSFDGECIREKEARYIEVCNDLS